MAYKIFCLIICCFSLSSSWSQAVLSGIVNRYAAVTAIDTCQNGVMVPNTIGFRTGSQAILIQMKGASIDVTDSPDFGNITALGQAGRYEKVAVSRVDGNLITFQNQLLNEYDVTGAVQLVSMPVFNHAIVRGQVQAQPWDGATGGVIAFDVRETLTLEADIDASGAGFQGGQANIQGDGNCSFAVNIRDYGGPIGDWRGAAKGEGVADWLTDLEAGRGAQANGGGGGNDHNSGGGGGANTTRGGRGGRNAEPSFFGCKGNFPGDGGKAISADTVRLYLGGGGGAGDENNNVATDGGAGGGIIILAVKNFSPNGFGLLANGDDAQNASGDGGGGGGAGGTILLQCEQLIDNLTIEVKGGKGGDIGNRNQDRCHGAGGGGSGGRYLGPPAWNPVVDLSGGQAGISMNSSDSSCGTSDNQAINGQEGIRQDKHRIAESQVLVVLPAIVSLPELPVVCEGDALMLLLEVEGENLRFQWQAMEGNDYLNLSEGTPYSGVHTAQLGIDPIPAILERSQYRLQVTTRCNELIFSDPINLTIEELPDAGFSFVQNEFSVTLNNQSDGAETQTWFFGDGNNSEEENPSHNYDANGDYEVVLVARNNCGTDTSRQQLSIDVGMAPSAAFSFSSLSGCSPLTVQFTNKSLGDYNETLWKFPGGAPAISTDPNPVVSYEQSGFYTFTLVLSGEAGIDSLVVEEQLNIPTTPSAKFDFTIADRTVTFQNNSTGANTYRWLFGDGTENGSITPSYTYPELGEYEVVLIAENECGQDTTRRLLTIGQVPQARYNYNPKGGCSPVKVQFFNQSTGDYTNVEWTFPGGEPATSNAQNPEVTYVEPGVYHSSLLVEGPLGNDRIEIENAIQILPIPEPAFTYELKGDTIFLQNNSTSAQSYLWNFGDDQTSREENPVHVFGQDGSFNVTLNVGNAYCGKSASQRVNVVITNMVETLREAGISLYPNPLKDWLYIDIEKGNFGSLSLTLLNSLGQRLERWDLYTSQPVSLANYPAGLYYLQISSESGEWISRVVKR